MHSRRKLFRTAVALGIAALAATTVVLAMGAREDGERKIMVVLKSVGAEDAPDEEMEFWQIVRHGMKTASQEYGLNPTIVGPPRERDIDEQVEIFAEVVAQRPDGIILAASDYEALAPLSKKAREKGIALVTIDSAVAGDAAASFVATDNLRAGEKAGAEMGALVSERKPVAIISHIHGVATAIDRERGVRQGLEESGAFTILGTFYADNNPELAYEIAIDLMNDHEDLGGIVTLNENTTVGAGRAIRNRGRAGEVKLVGFDHSKEEITFLEQGVIQALVVQKPFNMGYLAVQTLREVLAGRRVDAFIDTGSRLIRKTNMYEPQNEQLLFPF